MKWVKAVEYLDKEDIAGDYIGREAIEFAAGEVDTAINEWANKFDNAWDLQVAEGEHKTRDGFISFQEGNIQGSFYFSYGYEMPKVPAEAAKKLEENQEISQNMAAETFYDNNKEAIDNLLGEDNVKTDWELYSQLHDILDQQEKEKEQQLEMELKDPVIGPSKIEGLISDLEEYESESLSEDCVGLSRIEVYFYNDEEGARFAIVTSINWENPYFRSGKSNEYFIQSPDVDFKGLDDLKTKLPTELNNVMSKF